MKRVGGLFDRIWHASALAQAAWRAAVGKRDRTEVVAFFGQFEARIAALANAISSGEHAFGGYARFTVRDTKQRDIHAPPFVDRVVHHAIVAAVGPVLERGAIAHSHACRVGRGQAAGLSLARRRVAHAGAFLKLDVARFYDSIDHGHLRTALRRRLREQRLLDLFDRLLSSYQTAPGKGLPIGALTSQYLGNFYLDGFDRWAERQPGVMGYQRYMDDMLFFGELADLRPVCRSACEQLERLGLGVKHRGECNRTTLGVPWLGFTLYPDRTRLNRLGRRRLRRRYAELQRAARKGWLGERELQDRATALFAHARQADDIGWRRAMLACAGEREVLAPGEPGGSRRRVEQLRQEVPFCVSQQEEARQPQQEPGLSCLSGPRHGGALPPDGALSGAFAPVAEDEASGRAPAGAEIQRTESPEENASAGVPPRFWGPS